MAIAKVWHNNGINGLNQILNLNGSQAPVEGNLLVAFLGHDEAAGEDLADITSAGWTRMNTFEGPGDPDKRVSVWAKIAGASEPQFPVVTWDIGEVNRRVHGWVVEFSGFVGSVPAEDAALFSGGYTLSAETQQVDAAVVIATDNLGVAFMYTFSLFTPSSLSFDSGLNTIADLQSNFRGSGVGWIDGGGSLQPTATWTSLEEVTMIFVEIGAAAAGGGGGGALGLDLGLAI